jgi:hypothetical protein
MLVNKSFMTPLGSALSSAAIEKFHIGGASAYDLPFNPAPFCPTGRTGSFRRFLARKFFN